MSFTSQLYPGETIIDDASPDAATDAPYGQSRGLELPALRSYEGVAEAFPSELLIPRSEWEDRIKEQEERKLRLSDIATQGDLPCKDQDGIPYCWINAPTYCLELTRLKQNQEKVILSPASAGAPIKNFRAVGGWGKEGLQWIADKGLVPVERWPANAIDRKYWTEENKAIAMKYRTTEWWVLRERNLDDLVSCLLRGFPVAVGLNWWSHEVSYCDAVWLDGAVAIRQRNSWGMGWGEKGYGILKGSKMMPDDAVSPRVATAA